LKLSAKSNKDRDLIALREAINAYMRFIETHDVIVGF
jgi:tRNA threonylcarbamoyladenosine modification (KEOPS) complex  Pcc1 subunit